MKRVVVACLVAAGLAGCTAPASVAPPAPGGPTGTGSPVVSPSPSPTPTTVPFPAWQPGAEVPKGDLLAYMDTAARTQSSARTTTEVEIGRGDDQVSVEASVREDRSDPGALKRELTINSPIWFELLQDGQTVFVKSDELGEGWFAGTLDDLTSNDLREKVETAKGYATV